MSFQSELTGANFTWFRRILSKQSENFGAGEISSFTRVMMGELNEVDSGPVTLQDTTGKPLDLNLDGDFVAGRLSSNSRNSAWCSVENHPIAATLTRQPRI